MLRELSVAEQRYLAVLEVIAGVWVTESPNGTECRARACTWLRHQDEGASGLADHFHQAPEHPWRIPADVEERSANCAVGTPGGATQAGFRDGPPGLRGDPVYGLPNASAQWADRASFFDAAAGAGHRRWERPVPMQSIRLASPVLTTAAWLLTLSGTAYT